MEKKKQEGQNVNNQNELLNNDEDDGLFVVEKPLSLLKEIQKLMNETAGIIRDEARLQNGLKGILELKENFY